MTIVRYMASIWLMLGVVSLTGCAVTDALLAAQGLPTAKGRQQRVDPYGVDVSSSSQTPLPKPHPDVATVVGWGQTFTEGLGNGVPARAGLRLERLYVEAVDGHAVSTERNITTLPAGEHALRFSCLVAIDGMDYPRAPTVDVVVAAGHVYALHAKVQGTNCLPYLKEVI